jgi:Ca2+-binding RTX toxin-like protein
VSITAPVRTRRGRIALVAAAAGLGVAAVVYSPVIASAAPPKPPAAKAAPGGDIATLRSLPATLAGPRARAEALPATATTVHEGQNIGDPRALWIFAAPGVANQITIDGYDYNHMEIHDAAAEVVAVDGGYRCDTVDAHTLRRDSGFVVHVVLGDGDDHLTLSGVNQTDAMYYGGPGRDVMTGTAHADHLDGGPGDDTLIGGAGVDTFIGGAGVDTIRGGPGDDKVSGGDDGDHLYGDDDQDTINGDAGNDDLHGGKGIDALDDGPGDDTDNGDEDGNFIVAAPGADVIDGPVGTDFMSYEAYESGVIVRQEDSPNDGLPGERDNVRANIETVLGTHGPDTLIGNDGRNELIGLGGNDRLYGKGGNDYLNAGPGGGILDGGDGRDGCFPTVLFPRLTKTACDY